MLSLVAAAGTLVLAACTGGQSSVEPPSRAIDVQGTTAAQFRVGTARFGGATYLNVLVTYRQANGLSGTLYNTPTITGPAGFVVPAAASAGTDAGTNHISGTPPTQPGTPAVATTFGQTGGAFAYGFAPANSNTAGSPTYANAIGIGNGSSLTGCAFCAEVAPAGGFFGLYTQPIYRPASTRLPFLLGPPAVPDFHDGTFPNGFLGYDSGFTMFGATPVVGAYALHLVVPSANLGQNAAVFDLNASIASIAPLGPISAPVITPTAGGGASFVVAPGPPGVTNQVLYIIDISGANLPTGKNNPVFYAFRVPATGGTFTLSSTSGPRTPTGGASAPFPSGDDVFAYVVGADYDIVALAQPNNTQQLPALPAQPDISVSGMTAMSIP